MTEQEKLNSRVKRKIAVQNANIKALTEEMREFKDEMRQQNIMRANEVAEIRKSVESIQANGRNQTIAMVIGIAAMIITILLK